MKTRRLSGSAACSPPSWRRFNDDTGRGIVSGGRGGRRCPFTQEGAGVIHQHSRPQLPTANHHVHVASDFHPSLYQHLPSVTPSLHTRRAALAHTKSSAAFFMIYYR